MRIKDHVVLSPIAGGICFLATSDWVFAGLAIVSSVLIDVDHVLDRLIEERRITSISQMIETYELDQACKVYFVFHSIELLLVVLIIVGPSSLVGAVIVGFLFHISFDIYEWVWEQRKVSPFTYFFLYRLYHSFEYNRLLTAEQRTRIEQ